MTSRIKFIFHVLGYVPFWTQVHAPLHFSISQQILLVWYTVYWLKILGNKAEQYLIQLSQVISPSHINIFQSFSQRFSRILSFLTLPGKYLVVKDNNKAFLFSARKAFKQKMVQECLMIWPSQSLVLESGCMYHQSEDSIRVRFPGSRYRQIKPSMIRYHYFPLENI